jgi:hypothetical protein
MIDLRQAHDWFAERRAALSTIYSHALRDRFSSMITDRGQCITMV